MQRVTSLVNKLALLLHKCWLREDSRNKSENDWCRGRRFLQVAREQRSVAVGSKVMDTLMPQPAGCGDKYDVFGCRRVFSAFCMFFKYPSPEAYACPSPARGEGLHRPWCHKILGTDCASRPRMTGGRDANSFGRSIIEMLGVLAIISVLSVAGISGYSKAMEMYKLNKLIQEYNYYIFGMLNYIEDARRLTKSGTANIVGMGNFAEAANLIPIGWSGSIDSMGNYFTPFSRNTYLSFDLYIGWQKRNENGAMVSASYSDKFCTAVLSNVIQPLHYSLHSVGMNLGRSVNYYGDSACSDERLCLADLKPAEIHNLCKTCLKNEHACYIVLQF